MMLSYKTSTTLHIRSYLTKTDVTTFQVRCYIAKMMQPYILSHKTDRTLHVRCYRTSYWYNFTCKMPPYKTKTISHVRCFLTNLIQPYKFLGPCCSIACQRKLETLRMLGLKSLRSIWTFCCQLYRMSQNLVEQCPSTVKNRTVSYTR